MPAPPEGFSIAALAAVICLVGLLLIAFVMFDG